MAIPVCNLCFNPKLPDLSFQVSLITDTVETVSKVITSGEFIPDSFFLAFETETVEDVTTHTVQFLNETPDTKVMRIRNISSIPGVWSETVINNIQDPIEDTVPFVVDIVPSYTVFSMDLRWQLENEFGDIYGPYIGTVDNIKNVPAGTYILKVVDLIGNVYYTGEINTDSASQQVFIDIGYGTLKVNFTIPDDLNVNDFTYYLISDFGDTSLADNYNDVVYELENGLYYFVVLYQNNMLQYNDLDYANGIYIYKDVNKIVNITIDEVDDVLKIMSIVEG